jgi:hypothetical protein
MPSLAVPAPTIFSHRLKSTGPTRLLPWALWIHLNWTSRPDSTWVVSGRGARARPRRRNAAWSLATSLGQALMGTVVDTSPSQIICQCDTAAFSRLAKNTKTGRSLSSYVNEPETAKQLDPLFLEREPCTSSSPTTPRFYSQPYTRRVSVRVRGSLASKLWHVSSTRRSTQSRSPRTGPCP